MIEELKTQMNDNMGKVIKGLQGQLLKVRTGRASANALSGVQVDYYGVPTPIQQVGQISTPEARLLQIRPFDRSLIENIEKAILAANLNLTPSNDGNLIRIPFPALTEEKRKEIVRSVKKLGEESKIQIRNVRRDVNDAIKKSEKEKKISEDDSKRFQDEIQKLTDQFVKEVDQVMKGKEEEILTV